MTISHVALPQQRISQNALDAKEERKIGSETEKQALWHMLPSSDEGTSRLVSNKAYRKAVQSMSMRVLEMRFKNIIYHHVSVTRDENKVYTKPSISLLPAPQVVPH